MKLTNFLTNLLLFVPPSLLTNIRLSKEHGSMSSNRLNFSLFERTYWSQWEDSFCKTRNQKKMSKSIHFPLIMIGWREISHAFI